MREPSLPANTCPAIDEVQDYIKKAQDSVADADYQLNGLINQLEHLRDTNAELRACAEYWMDKAEELQNQLDEMPS